MDAAAAVTSSVRSLQTSSFYLLMGFEDKLPEASYPGMSVVEEAESWVKEKKRKDHPDDGMMGLYAMASRCC